MAGFKVSKQQRSLIKTKSSTKNTIFLEGPAGTGKTTVCVERMLNLLQTGQAAADDILILVPQRTLAAPYFEALRRPDFPDGGQPRIMTIGSLSAEAVAFFWPLIAAEAGFTQPRPEPTFLSLETAQYYMARLVGPLIEREGLFSTITIDRSRLYSQIIDALNKSAVVGFPHTEIGARLTAAWVGDEAQRRVYQELQRCVDLFRAYCLEHSLVDFSLQLELFMNNLWPLPECRNYLVARYRHLVVDNIEEDVPAAHQLIREWLPACQSALLVFDTDAGYRRFLGADPESAYSLKRLCKRREVFTETFVAPASLRAFGGELALSLGQPPAGEGGAVDPRDALEFVSHRFYPDLIDWTAEETARLVYGEGVPPGEIVILAPYLSDALRFSLENRLAALEVPVRAHRPSRALREQGAVGCMLTLAQLAHPDWRTQPASAADVAYALMQAIADMDLVRAQLLTQIVYRARDGARALSGFDQIEPEMQTRVTYELGERYERLRQWLEAYQVDTVYSAEPELPLDYFFSRLFGEVLSQPGFGFFDNFTAATHIANLVDSARRFRLALQGRPAGGKTLGQEYVEMVQAGVIANQYIRGWDLAAGSGAVLLTPAYTFLMRNQPVSYQLWLNVGGRGWSERLYQPLTHPYVLSAGWRAGDLWTDVEEYAAERAALYRLTQGLVQRCRQRIYLVFSELGEEGYEQRGALTEAVQRMLRRLTAPAAEALDV